MDNAAILQWNLNGFRPQREYLQKVMHSHSLPIICLQETNFSGEYIAPIKQYTGYTKNRLDTQHASGGVATYVLNTIPHREIPITTRLEAIAVSVFLTTTICICNIYLPNRVDIDIPTLSDLISQLPQPFVLMGDFNSHNLIWGDNSTDRRGKMIESLINTFDLVLLNYPAPTHYDIRYNTYSSIDLTICSPIIAPIFQWSVSTTLHGSDHFPITIKTDHILNINKRKPTWQLNKANWLGFKTLLHNAILELPEPDIFPTMDIDVIVDLFTSAIIKQAELCIPTNQHNYKKRQAPWWNDECKAAIIQKNKAYYKYKRHPNTPNKIEFQRLRTAARRTVKQSKRNSWLSFLSTINDKSPQSKLWQKLKAINGSSRSNHISHLQMPNSDYPIVDSQIIVNTLANTFAKISSDSNLSPNINQNKNMITQNLDIPSIFTNTNHTYNEELSIEEITEELRHCNSKSPGPDNIPYTIIKQLPANAMEYLQRLYNYIWTNKLFPNQWKISIVIPIPKPKKDHSSPENYRPISLTCTLCKLLEKIITKRLRWHLEVNHHLCAQQSGFRQNRSTLDNLLMLETEVLEAFDNQQHMVLISLDIEKAYDTVWRNYIIRTLMEYNVSGNMLSFIYNFLQNRRMSVSANGCTSEHVILQNGVPQGSILSVTLFLVAMNKVVSFLQAPVKAYLYADDVTLFCKGKNIRSTQQLLQSSLQEIQIWSHSTGFRFSPNKSQCIVFSRLRKQISDPKLIMENQQIPIVPTLRILGMYFDSKLTWVPHLKYLKAECVRRLNLMKTLSAKTWGADSSVLLRTYKATIRPKLDYGCIVYNSASSTNLQMLNTIQSSAIRIALGAYHTSPIESLLVEANEASLSLRRKTLSLMYSTRIATRLDSIVYPYVFPSGNRCNEARERSHRPSFSCRISQYFREIDIVPPSLRPISYNSTIIPWKLQTPPTITTLASHTKFETGASQFKRMFAEICGKHQNYKFIFTDGSKLDGNNGCAIVFPDHTRLYSLPKYLSIYSCELTAILHTMEFILQNDEYRSSIIFTDSMSSIFAIQQKTPKSVLVQDIIILYNQILKLNKCVKIAWIPSHIGIPGNEKADEAAREATKHPPSTDLQIPYQDFQLYLKQAINRQWKQQWSATSTSKLHQVCPTLNKEYPTKHLIRRDQVLLTRLRIGHTALTHSYILARDPPPMCVYCNSVLTVRHILIDCPSHTDHRRLCSVPNEPSIALNDPSNSDKIVKYMKMLNMYHLM